jgi:hypothetical protein
LVWRSFFSVERASNTQQTRPLQQLGTERNVQRADADQDDQHGLICGGAACDLAGHDLRHLAIDPLARQGAGPDHRREVAAPLAGEPLRWWTSVVRRETATDPLTKKTVQVILRALEKHDQRKRQPSRVV